MSKTNTSKQAKLLVYYDAECPLCIRTKKKVSSFDFRHQIDFKTVQFDAKHNSALNLIDKELLYRDIYSTDQQKKVYKGIDTYIQILNVIWFFRPLSWLIRLPGVYYLTKRIYQYIAKNRTTERCTTEHCAYKTPK